MRNKTILSFDLSSKCIGVVAVKIGACDFEPTVVKSVPIIPPNFCPSNLGYMKSKKKISTPNNKAYVNSYVKQGEMHVSKTEKNKRDVEVRSAKNLFVLDYIGKQIGYLISNIKPDLILVEKNEIFNGVLTSVLLGKVMGVLLGLAAQNNVRVIELKVTKVRSVFDVNKLAIDFTKGKSAEELKQIPDITKRALKFKMEELYGKYGLECQTDDESDACVVLHYWLDKKGDI
ncbi:MAG: hypothetical protein ACRCX2_21160 [Paraclostridium sp.]